MNAMISVDVKIFKVIIFEFAFMNAFILPDSFVLNVGPGL
jgi:hypothetical protein